MPVSPNYRRINDVCCLSPLDDAFQDLYLEIRSSENRLYSDEVVKNLPSLEKQHIYYHEWQMRYDSSRRVLKRIRDLGFRNILDLGCGNGWFTNKVAEIENTTVYGADINMVELEQATRLFSSKQCHFLYWNVFKNDWPGVHFDLVLLNSSVQYFDSLKKLTERLFEFMLPGGTIFIWDSPIYNELEGQKARQRSTQYFQSKQAPNMINHYHHHTWCEFVELDYSIIYNPEEFTKRILRKFYRKLSPFCLISILKPK